MPCTNVCKCIHVPGFSIEELLCGINRIVMLLGDDGGIIV